MDPTIDVTTLAQLPERLPRSSTVRGFVFNAMLDYLVDKKGAEAEAAVRTTVMKKRPSDLLSYSARDYFRLLHTVTVALEDPSGVPETLRLLGYACASGFFGSPMGKLLLGIVGRNNPARLMANEPMAYSTSFSFGNCSFKRTGERSLELTHAEDFLPAPYNVGALQGALTAVGATAREVVATPLGPDSFRYDITW